MSHERILGTEPLSPRMEISQRFIGLMRSAHADTKPRLSKKQASDLARVLMDVAEIAPEVSGVVLQRTVEANPSDLFSSTSTTYPGGVDFDVIAARWEDSRLAPARDVAETYYNFSETEVNFLRSGLGLPPLDIASSTDYVDPTGPDF